MRAVLSSLALLFVAAACGDDGRRPADGGGGGADAGRPRDGSSVTDGGQASDGGADDAGPGVDAGPGRDGGPRPDAGDCLPDGTSCDTAEECCGRRCTSLGACAPETCMVRHERCLRADECCEGAGACTGGYCGGPETPGCAMDGTTCWSQGQCCSNTCNVEGYCIAASDFMPPCVAAGTTCFFATDCCSDVCLPFTSVCASTMRGPWLP